MLPKPEMLAMISSRGSPQALAQPNADNSLPSCRHVLIMALDPNVRQQRTQVTGRSERSEGDG
jgi:hypothetical protein